MIGVGPNLVNPQSPPFPTHGTRTNDTARSASQDSIYAAPPRSFDPSTLGIQTKSQSAFRDGYVDIKHQAKWDMFASPPELKSVTLMVETGNAADSIHVGKHPDGQLGITINGRTFTFDDKDKNGHPLELNIKTMGGNDQVTVSPEVTNPVTLDGGTGNDTLVAGGGRTKLIGGAGNDVLQLGSNFGYAEGNDGDDVIIGGSGDAVMYGNNGNDRLYAGAGTKDKQSYLDGGSGNDQLYAGNGHTVLHGGKGNDEMVGHDRTTFYSGRGQDRIRNNNQNDLIYAKSGDVYDPYRGSKFTEITPSTAGNEGFEVEGSPEFKQWMADNFELLQNSPVGQKMLADMDKAGKENGAKVTIKEDMGRGSAYIYGSAKLKDAKDARIEAHLEKGTPLQGIRADDPLLGTIIDNKPGVRADAGQLTLDRMTIASPNGQFVFPPLITFVHEVGHAYNGATGTGLPGNTQERSAYSPERSKPVPNRELQAVGLRNSAVPQDLDGDPSTPPTTINPEHVTENGMRREMGLPERKTFLL